MHAISGRTDFKTMFFLEIIKERGLEHVTVEDLVAEITPKGRGMFTIYSIKLLDSRSPSSHADV